jgi:hypothetical protein
MLKKKGGRTKKSSPPRADVRGEILSGKGKLKRKR